MRFAAKRLCETSFYLQRGMKKEPRPEATLARFDNRLPRAGRPHRCHTSNRAIRKRGCLLALRLRRE